jgi:hypothetical protein
MPRPKQGNIDYIFENNKCALCTDMPWAATIQYRFCLRGSCRQPLTPPALQTLGVCAVWALHTKPPHIQAICSEPCYVLFAARGATLDDTADGLR